MTAAIRIGLIEDNLSFRADLAFFLRRQGYAVVLESDGRQIDQALEQTPCDLLLLDLGLPAEDGLSIARRLRQQHPKTGLVMLTARGSQADRLIGLEEGADAYLVKPVDFRELVAVLQNLLRRLDTGSSTLSPTDGWRLQPSSLQLFPPEGPPIKLTGQEVKLLRQMIAAYPDAAPRSAMLTSGQQALDPLDYRRLEAALSRLRKKLQEATGEQLIFAARNEGYLFGAPIHLAEA
ncbi:MAG: response regulator transcription factor [Planctomycetes bacterium]|nr:response regulator transcription factor [Planctomycetota bacterium]